MKAYYVYCSTGCTCCSNENHYRGPYSSAEIAQKAVDHFRETKILASQYARSGCYSINSGDAEQLPDGRLIIGDKVFPGFMDDDFTYEFEF